MVASNSQNGTCLPLKTSKTAHGPSPCEWRLVNHFNTVEEAERVVDTLRRDGVEAEVSLIDGLSVIARRTIGTCDPSLC